MSQTELIYRTFDCDAAGCPEALALGGVNAQNEAINAGWALEVPFFDKFLDFCPACVKELKGFVEDNAE